MRNNHLESELDTGRGSLGQKDFGRISWVSVTLRNELGDALADVRDSLRVGVSTNRANVLEQQLCASNSIAGVELGSSLGVLILEELWVFNKRSNLDRKKDEEETRRGDIFVNVRRGLVFHF